MRRFNAPNGLGDGAAPPEGGTGCRDSGPPVSIPDGGDAGDDAEASDDTGDAPSLSVLQVRDAFAGLQATRSESCASDCAYFLGRVHDELEGMDDAMKADAKGPGHFSGPIDWIAKLNGTLGKDPSYTNLKEHQILLISTRDRINTWMQGHPEDYR